MCDALLALNETFFASPMDALSGAHFHAGGKKKRGATRSVYPSTAPGRIGAVVRFNEKFDVSASLYKVGLPMLAMRMAARVLGMGR